MTLEIKLKRPSKVYRPGEVVKGSLLIETRSDISHTGLFLNLEGIVNMQLSSKSVGIFEAFYNSVKPIQLISINLEVQKAGKFPTGVTTIPFEFPLKSKSNKPLYDSYHGVFISVQYTLHAELRRGILNKPILKNLEFIMEGDRVAKNTDQPPIPFTITPQSLENIREIKSVPDFKISGTLERAVCDIEQPLQGTIMVEHSAKPIKSVELQLVRVETCGCAEGYAKDATEIQNIQIAEGDVMKGLAIPVHMVFPRLFTCVTTATNNFKIEFEVNIVIVLQDDHLITENFPIKLYRPSK
ncbi:vacuolar protein sorting-associated protein 26C-like [Bolinopsis microptera]|uniref:vacuolar protein sorting-associated protein 26C-like n=1 Tax=Bolinopsis microptera TaxID=2820187 RepID=UPI00307A3333